MKIEELHRCDDCYKEDRGRWKQVPSRKYPYKTAVLCRECGRLIGYINRSKEDE